MSKFSIKITANTYNIVAESTVIFNIPLSGYNGACHGLLTIGTGTSDKAGPTLALKLNRRAKLSIKFDGYFDLNLSCGFFNYAEIYGTPQLVVINKSAPDFTGVIYKELECEILSPEVINSSASGSGVVTTDILEEGQIIYIYIRYTITLKTVVFSEKLQINNNSYIFTIQEIL
jgi:hypothetical protein